MELRTVDGKTRIVTKEGKKELVQTLDQFIAQAEKRIHDAKAMLQNLAFTRAEQQSRLEDALLSGISTTPARKELATIAELIDDQDKEVTEAQHDIAEVNALIDRDRAQQIYQQDAEAVAALVKPFTDFLQEHRK